VNTVLIYWFNIWSWVVVTIWPWVVAHEQLAGCLLTVLIIMAGWIWAILAVKAMKRSSELQILLSLGQYWDRGMGMDTWVKIAEIEMGNLDFTETLREYRKTSPRDYHAMLNLPSFFEDIGWMAKHGHIKLKNILQLYKAPISETYKKYEGWINILRDEEKESGDKPQVYDYFIWLANKAKGKNKL